MKNLKTRDPVKQLCCYKCGNKSQICVEEKKCEETGEIVEKNFICAKCARIFQNGLI